jgi:hypothetical protein
LHFKTKPITKQKRVLSKGVYLIKRLPLNRQAKLNTFIAPHEHPTVKHHARTPRMDTAMKRHAIITTEKPT